MAGEYEVGYRRPPKTTRFKPGQSGNPKGRPAKSRNFKSDVKKTLETPIRLVKDGKPQTVSTQEGVLLRLSEKALKGGCPIAGSPGDARASLQRGRAGHGRRRRIGRAGSRDSRKLPRAGFASGDKC